MGKECRAGGEALEARVVHSRRVGSLNPLLNSLPGWRAALLVPSCLEVAAKEKEERNGPSWDVRPPVWSGKPRC